MFSFLLKLISESPSTWDSVNPVLSSTGPECSCSIEYKIWLFVLKSLHSLAPSYISDLLCLQNTSWVLRSSNQILLTFSWTWMNFKGDQSFSVTAPRLWTVYQFHKGHFKIQTKNFFFARHLKVVSGLLIIVLSAFVSWCFNFSFDVLP